MARKSYRPAVVIFHGMGEQVPMKTVRGFVAAVWQQDSDLINSDRPLRHSHGDRGGHVIGLRAFNVSQSERSRNGVATSVSGRLRRRGARNPMSAFAPKLA